nr:MAG: hypothetical protein [Molluscum contagiosum virus]
MADICRRHRHTVLCRRRTVTTLVRTPARVPTRVPALIPYPRTPPCRQLFPEFRLLLAFEGMPFCTCLLSLGCSLLFLAAPPSAT